MQEFFFFFFGIRLNVILGKNYKSMCLPFAQQARWPKSSGYIISLHVEESQNWLQVDVDLINSTRLSI